MKEIPLTQGKVAKVSDHRFDYLNQWKWYFNGQYAVRNSKTLFGKRKSIYMHCEILPHPIGFQTDHWDLDKLNNQDENLRVVEDVGNRRNRGPQSNNSTGYKGVYPHKKNRKYIAQITVNNQQIYLGSFETPEEAARIYDTAAKEHFGIFARTNF